jgi:hypothetical protein
VVVVVVVVVVVESVAHGASSLLTGSKRAARSLSLLSLRAT